MHDYELEPDELDLSGLYTFLTYLCHALPLQDVASMAFEDDRIIPGDWYLAFGHCERLDHLKVKGQAATSFANAMWGTGYCFNPLDLELLVDD